MARDPIEFKALVRYADGNVEWEDCINRVLDPKNAVPQGPARPATMTLRWEFGKEIQMT